MPLVSSLGPQGDWPDASPQFHWSGSFAKIFREEKEKKGVLVRSSIKHFIPYVRVLESKELISLGV